MTHDTAHTGSATGSGAPAPSDHNSLTIGADGPILLHDHHFIEQMAHFDRARVAERNVDTKRSAAFGQTSVTDEVSAKAKAATFQPGVETDMQWDFSTLKAKSAHQVTYLEGDRGGPRSWRHMNGSGTDTHLWCTDGEEGKDVDPDPRTPSRSSE